MYEVEIFSDEKYLKLHQKAKNDVDLNKHKGNLQEALYNLPVLFTQYNKLYFDQRHILKKLQMNMKSLRKSTYHYYKFDGDYKLDTATEINGYVDGHKDILELNVLIDRQEAIVDFLHDIVAQINKNGYLIKSIIELEKLRNGVMS